MRTILFKPCLTVVLTAFLLAPFRYASSDPTRERITTEGEGEAEIYDLDLSRARKEALEDALQKAFENAMVEILPLDLTIGTRHDLIDQLAPALRSFLLQYRIVSEMPAPQVFFIKVEATFSTPLVRAELVKRGVTWADEAKGEPVEIFVRIQGVSSFLLYQQVLAMFKKGLVHVRTATPHEIFGTGMVLRLEYERELDDLLGAISSWRSEEFELRIEQVSDREITASLVTSSLWGDTPPLSEVPFPFESPGN